MALMILSDTFSSSDVSYISLPVQIQVKEEKLNQVKFSFSHFFVVCQKVL